MLHHDLVVLGVALNNAANRNNGIDFSVGEHLLDGKRHIIGAGHVEALGHFCSEKCCMFAAFNLHHVCDVTVKLRDNESEFYGVGVTHTQSSRVEGHKFVSSSLPACRAGIGKSLPLPGARLALEVPWM